MKKTYLVLGATGKTGRKVSRFLRQAKLKVREGSRQAEIPFDWENAATWPAVLKGVHSMYISYHPDLAVPGALAKIEALVQEAVKQRIKKVVLLSGKGEKEAELCEQVLMNSGLNYSIVRASWFNQNFSESFFLPAILEGDVALPMAQARVPYIDTDDIAEVVFRCMVDEQHDRRLYELTGPRALSFQQVMEEIAVASGREITFTPISLPAYLSRLGSLGVDKDFIWLIQYLFTEVLLEPKNSSISSDVRKVLGRSPKDFRVFAQEEARKGTWH